jgi:hypothetical protein
MYRRSLTLPPGTNPEKAEANYRNGVLELHFARSPEAKGKRIPIQGPGRPQAALSQQSATQPSATGTEAETRKAASARGAKQG